MNYIKAYNQIIVRARPRGLNKKTIGYYTEKHHIKPKCLGGSNSKENLVLLSAREHYLCHWLLWKNDIINNSLFLSYHKMVFSKNTKQKRKYKISSKQYEELKCMKSSMMKGKNNPMHTHEIDFKGQKNPFYGKKHKPETIEKFKNKSKKTRESSRNRMIEMNKQRSGINSHNFKGYIVSPEGKKFITAKEAKRYYNIPVATINYRARNNLFGWTRTKKI